MILWRSAVSKKDGCAHPWNGFPRPSFSPATWQWSVETIPSDPKGVPRNIEMCRKHEWKAHCQKRGSQQQVVFERTRTLLDHETRMTATWSMAAWTAQRKVS